ncbi:MAG TPA: hypothetical protein VGP46_12245, partial [Acidimicrobiales bacterium]|nr:hypothetical protein [Acidimicrobiales bacterium]
MPEVTAGASDAAVKWAVETPRSQTLPKDELSGVQCTTAAWCAAVGSTEAGMLAEIWNGKNWTVYQPSAGAGQVDPGLNSVGCSSASDCVAVGAYLPPQGSLRLGPLSELWNGKTWAQSPTPLSKGDSNGYLTKISCVGATFCMAVGFESVNSSSFELPLAEVWNGHSWRLVPPKESQQDTGLYGLSCVSTTDCRALGGDPTQVFTWNGSAWSIKNLPEPSGGKVLILDDLSCAATTSCMGVGSYISSPDTDVPISEALNGTAWSVVPTASSSGLPNLASVHCASKSDCVTVGSLLAGKVPNVVDTPISERWDGKKWSMLTTARPPGSSSLDGVSCSAASACLAVGQSSQGTETLDLAEAWNGHSWGILASVASPVSALPFVLTSVSCLAPHRCEAVGASSVFGANLALGEQWGGASWKLSIAAGADTPEDILTSVSCSSTSSCVALGADEIGLPVSFLWNGHSWSVGPAPAAPKNAQLELMQVSCGSATSCIAVGSYAGSKGPYPLAETWNGKSWKLASLSAPGNEFGQLQSVSCVAASVCVAVGFDDTSLSSSGKVSGFAAHWNGTTWTVYKGAAPAGTVDATFNGVSCTRATSSCTVVGAYTKTGKNSLNLIDSFDD